MYLKRIVSENVGPIEKIDITPSFNTDGSPKPLILVGGNGSGKSTVLSNIVDSFYNFADETFLNVMVGTDSFSKKYYKAIMPLEIHSGSSYMYSYLAYENPSASYFFKSGNFSNEDFLKKNEKNISLGFSWEKEGNVKLSNISKKDAKDSFEKNVICYFAPNRYEKPVWMANEYFSLKTNPNHVTIKGRWDGELSKPITINDATNNNLLWLLDVIVDSRADVAGDVNNLQLAHVNAGTLIFLRKTRENVEQVLSQILGQNVYFSLNLRNSGLSRFCIKENVTDKIVAPTLDSLSTGQLALFNMFSTIIRYGDASNFHNSVSLSEISGIVVIDEIELHLHSNLQKEILPRLIKLFPKVQFVITSHSPLFLLGMKDFLGEDCFDVIEMPSGNRIDVERFSEFQKAYDYYCDTQKHQEELTSIINQVKAESSEKPLVITEGHTDWKHLKAAFDALKSKENCNEIKNLEFEFLEYEAGNSTSNAVMKLEMGNKTLTNMCETMAKLHQPRKVIFIADCDDRNTNSKLSVKNENFKKWGNNVFSFTLPIPSSRQETPEICIEHLYSDDEIKTECQINGINRRLFMGGEFDELGLSIELGLVCCNKNFCGPGKINIIEGRSGERVLQISGNRDINFALTKTEFANNVLNKISPFDNFDFSNFIEASSTCVEAFRQPC